MSISPLFFQVLTPVIFLPLIFLEYRRYRKLKRTYQSQEVAASVGVYFGMVVAKLLTGGLVFSLFGWFSQYALFDISLSNPWSWVGLFLGVEFFYYWMHRTSHEVRWLWASHGVHHSASQINLPASLRLGWTGAIAGVPLFFLPLVLIGFNPIAVFGMLAFNLIFQFFLHTELVGKLASPIEYVFNTPSHHRVHHASNPEYIDKNHGGILIIFDRMFGTFREEDETIPIRFGLTTPVKSNNPFVIALGETAKMLKDAFTARSLSDALMYLFGSPAWKPVPVQERVESRRRA